MISDIAYAVNFFLGTAGGNEHLYALVILIRHKGIFDGFDNCLGLGHFTLSHVAARKTSRNRFDNLIALLFKPFDVFDGILVLVHIRIHCGTHDFRRFAGHNRGREHIVRNAVGNFTDCVGSSGRDNENVGFFGKRNVFDFKVEIPVEKVCYDPIPRQRFER